MVASGERRGQHELVERQGPIGGHGRLAEVREQVGEELDEMLRELAAAMEARAG